jgi:hypothetical protein
MSTSDTAAYELRTSILSSFVLTRNVASALRFDGSASPTQVLKRLRVAQPVPTLPNDLSSVDRLFSNYADNHLLRPILHLAAGLVPEADMPTRIVAGAVILQQLNSSIYSLCGQEFAGESQTAVEAQSQLQAAVSLAQLARDKLSAASALDPEALLSDFDSALGSATAGSPTAAAAAFSAALEPFAADIDSAMQLFKSFQIASSIDPPHAMVDLQCPIAVEPFDIAAAERTLVTLATFCRARHLQAATGKGEAPVFVVAEDSGRKQAQATIRALDSVKALEPLAGTLMTAHAASQKAIAEYAPFLTHDAQAATRKRLLPLVTALEAAVQRKVEAEGRLADAEAAKERLGAQLAAIRQAAEQLAMVLQAWISEVLEFPVKIVV